MISFTSKLLKCNDNTFSNKYCMLPNAAIFISNISLLVFLKCPCVRWNRVGIQERSFFLGYCQQ